ncbi:MAG TPA: endopeptidase La [Rhodanobacteraceae bacterium]|nr:endopeptidase La [Rhodanobacteraceae bacterium]
MAQKTPQVTRAQGALLPVLPLRDVVVFPQMVIPLFVGREPSMQALETAMADDRQILLVAQKGPEIDAPGADDLYQVGTLANILQLLKLPDGTIKALVEGQSRAQLDELTSSSDGMLQAKAVALEPVWGGDPREVEVAARTLVTQFEQLVKNNRKVPPEVLTALSGIDDPSRLADSIAAHLSVRLADKQRALETLDVGTRLEMLAALVEAEMDLAQIEKRIRGRIKSQMERSQREYYLNEQMKAIQKELGEVEDAPGELDELARKIDGAGMPKETRAKAQRELGKLRHMSPMSAEAAVVRNYLDWLVAVPWKQRSKISKDLSQAAAVLDADHFGLQRVKERILEYLAVQARVNTMKGPILCLVGPPGVGKTSLGKSIAKATNRKFVRMSLGGVRDEAEIRGHRRTYIGSMPGRIIQNMSKAGSRNPLFMLDEIDKMAMDFRGDPSSALLEVLDPEQNHAFNDHYLEVDFDLSETMWIATANSLNIPGPLLDRMEVIRIPGYTEDEKLEIAQRYLVPKQLRENGLEASELTLSTAAIRDIVRYYTRESGVRNLEREIAKICRKVVKELSLTPEQAAKAAKAEKAEKTGKRGKGKVDKAAVEAAKAHRVQVSVRNLGHYLGVRRFTFGQAERQNEIGLVTGLAWTQVGGDLLSIEATVVPGRGKLIHTGQLGDVMQESIHAALSVVRARTEPFGIDPEFYHKQDIHIHVPEGATPKDGPSAGVGMCTALVSALTRVPVRSEVAMTGEITLRGRVLPIGGLKEKLLAAHRGGITTVIIPEENRKDLADIPANVTESLELRPVRWIDEVLDIALERPLAPLPRADEKPLEKEAGDGRDQTESPARPH